VGFQGVGKALIIFFKEANDTKSIQEFHLGRVCGTQSEWEKYRPDML